MVWHNNILKQFKIVNPQTKNEDIFYGAYNTLLTSGKPLVCFLVLFVLLLLFSSEKSKFLESTDYL